MMNHARFQWISTILFCLSPSANAAEPAAATVFDGKSLAGWQGNAEYWRVEDGAITGEIPAGKELRRNEFLFWKDDVHDFELTLEYRIGGVASANSGIQFRSQRTSEGGAAGYQADLDDGATWLGRIYDEHGRELIVERGARVSIAPDGRRWSDPFASADRFKSLPQRDGWNEYRIKATGPHVEVWINGTLCSVLDDHEMGAAEYSGKLAFQLHSGPGPAKVQFRDIKLTSLGKTEFPKGGATQPNKDNRQTQSPVLWHLRPNPAKPSPIDNAEAQRVVGGMLLTDGFSADLIAAEPDIHQPIAFTIDERGRLWVAEAFSYPTKQPAGKGLDRIRILEDADGDGIFEIKKTFTHGLNLVSGIELGFGGVWIGAAPELLFIPDRDHDDRPDGPPQVLLDGFGYQDTHETLNSFVWGPDGWLYGNQGVFNTALIGKPGAPDSQRLELRAGIWRFHPLRHEFEIFAHGGSNQWGLAFNDAGHLFMTHCRSYWGGGGTTYVIQNGHFWNQTNSNYPAFVSGSAPPGIPHLQNYLPASAKYDSGEGGAGKPGTTAIYGGHSHVGTMVYLGDNWPAIYRDHLFTHNLHGHQMNHQVNVRQGSAYETFHAGYDLMYAPDPAYVAVDLKYGPDGAVYAIDWVDKQHCHNPRGETWDRTNGRIYRIAWGETFRPVRVDLASKSDRELVELQAHPNRWYGRTARRLLQERANAGGINEDVVGALGATLASSKDQAQSLCALWTLHVIGKLDSSLMQLAITDSDDVVRAWTIRLATERVNEPSISTDALTKLASNDPAAPVRLALASALPRVKEEDRWQIGAALAAHKEDAGDRFLPKMVWFGLAPLVSKDVKRALQLATTTPIDSLADSIHWHAGRFPAGRDALTQTIAFTSSNEHANHLLRLMHFSLQQEAKLPMPAGWSATADRFEKGGDMQLARMHEDLSATFGDERVFERMRAELVDVKAPLDERRRALAVLSRAGDEKASATYVRLLDDRRLRAEVIPLLARSADPAIATMLLERFESFDEKERGAALGVLTSRAAFALPLLRAVNGKTLDRKHLTALQIRQLHNLSHPEVTKLLEKVWGKVGASSADAAKTIARLKHTYETAPLWAYSEKRGGEIYKKTCAACHPLDGTSVPLGPGLAGSWRNGVGYFLENVVDPNAVVGENFRTTLIVTEEGTVVTGLLDRETETSVILRTADQKTVSVPKSEIAERKITDQSIMPTGLLDTLSEVETIELLKFLTTQKN